MEQTLMNLKFPTSVSENLVFNNKRLPELCMNSSRTAKANSKTTLSKTETLRKCPGNLTDSKNNTAIQDYKLSAYSSELDPFCECRINQGMKFEQ